MKYLSISSLLLFLLLSCDKQEVLPATTYACELSRPAMGADYPLADEFNRLLDSAVPLTTGMQLAVTDAQGNTWSGSRGFADIGNNVPVENCHRFAIASISKTVTAAMILQLVDEGRLDLEDPLTDYLSANVIRDLPNADRATLRQLLNHTSGIPDYLTQEQALASQNTPFLIQTQLEKLDYARGLPELSSLGASYNYSNTNFLLLGLVVSAVRDQPLWDVIDEQFSRPLGLQRFAMGTETVPLPEDVVRPYVAFSGGNFIDVTPTAVSDMATGDGGIHSNMLDLNEWFRALFDGEILAAATLNKMTGNPILTNDGSDFPEWPDEGYGLGISRYNTPQGVAFGHTGSTSAYNSILLYFPDTGVALSVVVSGVDLELADELEEKVKEIRDTALGLLLP